MAPVRNCELSVPRPLLLDELGAEPVRHRRAERRHDVLQGQPVRAVGFQDDEAVTPQLLQIR
ncbi:hypothetical protein [Streptomyces rubradiris]|uniref:hypothetical protein n=1 Tax=Streptomyces rubradiris TaxID=285531 RepID=UPI001E2F6C8A|nr:hypothetical protein [Streptomyces rubradiris]